MCAIVEEYAAEMNKYGIPFGVYCYSYAGDRAKARDEAKKMVSYASKYNNCYYSQFLLPNRRALLINNNQNKLI